MGRFLLTGSFALGIATAKTLIRVNTPSSRKIALRHIVVTDKLAGASDEGIAVRVLTGGTDGTGTAATPLPLGGAAACVSSAKVNYTVEPTGSPVEVARFAVPAGGGIDLAFEGPSSIEVPHSSAIALEVTAAQARGSNIVYVALEFEE